MRNNIVFLETTIGWPNVFSANNTKVEFLAKGLREQGNLVTLINSMAGESGTKGVIKNEHEGFTFYNYPRILNQTISRIINFGNFIRLLRICKKKDTKNIIVMGGPYYPFFLLIVVIAKLFGYKITVTLTEWAVGIKTASMARRIDFYLYNHTFGYLVDGIFPISTFLESKVQKFKKPNLLVPITADFFNESFKENELTDSYFLYCSSVAYAHTIYMLLDAYNIYSQVDTKNRLVLILSGSEDKIEVFRKKVASYHLTGQIIIRTKLAYKELLTSYSKALALLIPLDNTIQDVARFSQKIAEYISSFRPILTNNVGDVDFYFKNMETAYFASDFSAQAIADQMLLISKDTEKATQIGLNGRKLGEKEFDYRVIGKKMNLFFEKI